MATAERISVQSSASIGAEEGVTASTAYTTGLAATGMRVSLTLRGMKRRTQAGTLRYALVVGRGVEVGVRPVALVEPPRSGPVDVQVVEDLLGAGEITTTSSLSKSGTPAEARRWVRAFRSR